MKRWAAIGLAACAFLQAAEPALRTGEGLALAARGGELRSRGEARAEGPLGDLACLPWLRLEGFAWSSAKLDFHCRGAVGELRCTTPKGHGRIDLRKAFERNCRLALQAWIQWSAAGWTRLEGPAIARLKLLEVFQPFLGARLPKGEELPALGPEWAGAAGLLRASPESLARWLADPAQEPGESMFRRYGAGFFEGDLGDYRGWAYVGRGGEGAQACTWVAGGREGRVAVLRLPGTPPREEALQRFRELVRAPAP